MNTDLILPGGGSKKQPVAVIAGMFVGHSSYQILSVNNNVSQSMARSFTDHFSSENYYSLTCKKAGTYLFSSYLRNRYLKYYVRVNGEDAYVVNGMGNGNLTVEFTEEHELQLKEGDVVTASVLWPSAVPDFRFGLGCTNIFKA